MNCNHRQSVLLAAIAMSLLLMSGISQRTSFAQILNEGDGDKMLLTVNFDRIKTHLAMVETSHVAKNTTIAFGHAYLIHSATFPSIDAILERMNPDLYRILESRLANLAFHIHAQHMTTDEIRQEIAKLNALIDSYASELDEKFSTDKVILSQRVVILLNDSASYYKEYKYYEGLFPNCTYQQAFSRYQLSNAEASSLNYESARGFAQAAEEKYLNMSHIFEKRRDSEIKSFFTEMRASIDAKKDSAIVENYVRAIERDLLEEVSSEAGNSGENSSSGYVLRIRELLFAVIEEVKTGNYAKAEEHAISAYLDNYEYLEAPLEKYDSELMAEIELQMREELRSMIKSHQPSEEIEGLVMQILASLERAENILAEHSEVDTRSSMTTGRFANIEGLKEGFGTYSGPSKNMGEADESQKSSVRDDVDKIRQSLDGVLRIYKDGNRDDAFILAQSAYLENYERIEVPLRPIDPNFTLEMEIRFAELRNLIQSGAEFSMIEAKVVELRKGLDESERMVHGTGTIAPLIALTTSFMIIFRDGLEGAIIIGTILTYLESTRNERFKRHLYLGIVLAVAGSLFTWLAAEFVVEITNTDASLVKTIASASAVAVLFWVSFWILGRINGRRWAEFLQAKVWKAATTGTGLIFTTLAFVTVYREGFSAALFFQAMFSLARYMELYVLFGMIAGFGAVFAIAVLTRKIGRKVPLRVLFGVTLVIGAYMSISFVGNTVRELQVIGYLPTTHLLGLVPRLEISLATMTGIHPTAETIIAQLLLGLAYFIGAVYLLILGPRKQSLIEMSRKTRNVKNRHLDTDRS
jgi:high-affinity iron transporter